MRQTYVVAGATGKTGFVIARNLLAKGIKVKALVHQENSKSDVLKKAGAEILVGNLEDQEYLTAACRQADSFYAMLPYNYGAADLNQYQYSINRAIHQSLHTSEIKDVIVLSSFGTHSPYPNSVLKGLNDLELRLSSLNSLNVLVIRAGFFYENFLGMVELAKSKNILGGFPLEGHIKAPMIATKDIADYATERFLAADFKGFSIVHLAGPDTFTFDEAATLLGQAIDKPELSWVNFGYDGAKEGLMQNGFSESTASAFVSFAKQANDGELWGYYTHDRSKTTTTKLQEFAQDFKTAFKQ